MSEKARASRGDRRAVERMFSTMLGAGESIRFATYLGIRGVFGIGPRSFAAVTDKRLIGMELRPFGGVRAGDAYLEHYNSSRLYQPSRFVMLLLGVLWLASFGLGGGTALYVAQRATIELGTEVDTGALMARIGLSLIPGLLTLPIVTRVYYRFVKSGIGFLVREGAPVQVFADRSRIPRVFELRRAASDAREARLRDLSARRPVDGELLIS